MANSFGENYMGYHVRIFFDGRCYMLTAYNPYGNLCRRSGFKNFETARASWTLMKNEILENGGFWSRDADGSVVTNIDGTPVLIRPTIMEWFNEE
jgi:hypothetical protein